MASEEKVYLEEERSRIIARVDDLKCRVSELERQLQETRQEVSNTHAAWAGGVFAGTRQEGLCLSAGGDGAGPAAG